MPSPVKVAVLDDYQGLSEPHFQALDTASYDVTFFKDTLLPYNHKDTPQEVKDQLAKRLEPFEIISTMRERTPFPAELIARLPHLKLLLTTGTKNASLDLPAFAARGIPVAGAGDTGDPTATPTARGPDSTTQHCVALILAAVRNLSQDDRSVRAAGGWQTGYALSLVGKTLGVVGLGRLGVSVSRIMAQSFGMHVVAWSPNLTQAIADERARTAGFPEGTFRVVSKAELFATADVVSIQLVLSERSRGIIAAPDLARMKPTAVFVNTSRGPLVVERDLLDVLERGAIRAAALDVYEIEPLPLDSPWRTTAWGQDGRTEVLLSPHMGYVEKGTLDGWYAQHVKDILRWEKGEKVALPLY